MRGVEPGLGRRGGAVEIGLSGAGNFRLRWSARLRLGGRVLEGCEIGEKVGAAARVLHHHRHRRAWHELGRVGQELDEGVGVPGEARALERRGEVRPCSDPALRPETPASEGPIPFTPGWLEWQAEHCA